MNSPDSTSDSTSNASRDLERIFRSLYLIRHVEERIAEIYPTDKIKSPVHLSVGQEAVAVGVCEALEPGDSVFGTYRGHAMYLAKGGSLPRMIAELYGKSGGCAFGRGGSMHLIDLAAGVMGTSAVVASTIPNAVGYAYAQKYLKKTSIVVSFFGDGATEEGVFFESLNFAALKKLPILFVCENNRYAIHTHQTKRQASLDICARARAFGVRTITIEENDVLSILSSCQSLVSEIRQGSGPALIECMTYRWLEHVGPGEDFALGFRDHEEATLWKRDDQVFKIGKLIENELRVSEIMREVQAEVTSAIAFAEESVFPDPSELLNGNYRVNA